MVDISTSSQMKSNVRGKKFWVYGKVFFYFFLNFISYIDTM